MKHIVATGAFDDLGSRSIRFLEEAAKLGELEVRLWSDAACEGIHGTSPKFPVAERRYFLESLRYVSRVALPSDPFAPDQLPAVADLKPDIWVVREAEANPAKSRFCAGTGLDLRIIEESHLVRIPAAAPTPTGLAPSRRKVLVTGCYDWFHSGHVRFFEEVSALGDLYVIVGNDANVRQLKGEGHPMYREEERRYIAGSVRFATQALISTGSGWMDAEPEIMKIKPDIYAVNEDGDRPEKREFCARHGIDYRVLKRTPKPGLPRRQSTDLRGF